MMAYSSEFKPTSETACGFRQIAWDSDRLQKVSATGGVFPVRMLGFASLLSGHDFVAGLGIS